MGPWLAFDSRWFAKHQRKLLWLANHPLLKYKFRYDLRIHNDVGWNERIIQIQPNNYKVFRGIKNGRVYVKADFRTHNKFSKRLYFSYSSAWWMLHAWDSLVADRWIPQLGFGFASLTKYPDPDPETTTVDGRVGQSYDAGSGVSFATMRNAAGSDYTDSSATIIIQVGADNVSDQWINLRRLIALFDTSSIGATSTISAAVNSYYGSAKGDLQSWAPTYNVYSSAPASNTALANGDYDSLGTTEFATGIAQGSISITGYNDFTLNAAGLAAIAKAGVTKLGVRNATHDVANSAPSWASLGSVNITVYSADQTGTDNDPKLVVTYTIPALTISVQECPPVEDCIV